MKKIVCMLLAVMMILTFTACAKEEVPADDADNTPAEIPADDEAGTPADDAEDTAVVELAEWEKELAEKFEMSGDEAFTLAFISLDYTNKFDQRIREASHSYITENYPNCKWLEADGEYDANIQIGHIENYIASGADAVMIVAADSEACGSICGLMKEAQLPLININTAIKCGDDDCTLHNFVGSPDYVAGKLQAEYLIENVDDTETQKLCYLEGDSGYAMTLLRKNGFFETLDAAGYNYELLASLDGEWKREVCLEIAEDWAVKFGDEIDIICAAGDEMGWGALEAMKGAGIEGVKILGIDANDDTKISIKEGGFACTIFQNAAGQGKWGAIQAYNACLGKPTGEVEVPYETVTIENIDQYL